MTWQVEDRLQVRQVLQGFRPSEPGNNWKGVLEPNRIADLEPSAHRRDPTLAVSWSVEVSGDPDAIQGTLDNGPPVRKGHIELVIWCDANVSTGPLETLAADLLLYVEAESTNWGNLVVFGQDATFGTLGLHEGTNLHMELLRIPYVGSG